MFSSRTSYRIAGFVLVVGAVAALTIQEWVSLAVFLLLAALMFFLSERVERWMDERSGGDRR